MTAAAPARTTAASAMGKTGAAALASALLAALGTKIIAVWLGPAWIGLLTTLAQTRQTALVAATANGQTALVQGIGSLEAPARGEYLRTSITVIGAATLVAAAVLIFARERVAAAVGLTRDSGALVAWLAVPVILGSAAVVMTALLNALGAIGRLAKLQIVGPAAMAILAVPAAVLATTLATGEALVAMLALSALASAAAAWWLLRGFRATISTWIQEPGRWWSSRAAERFFSISGAMAATGMLASAGLVAVRARIIRHAGLAAAGNFDAAWAISMNQVTLVLASMQTYYLPELARARSDSQRRERVTEVFKMAILVSAPAIAAIALAKPAILRILYSAKFAGAGDLLRWTLVGDYLKVTSWVLAIPMIAAADMRAFLAVDTLAQVVFLGSSWALGTVRGPAQGAAMGFAACYAVNLTVCYWYVRRTIGWRCGPAAALWAGGLALVCAANWIGR